MICVVACRPSSLTKQGPAVTTELRSHRGNSGMRDAQTCMINYGTAVFGNMDSDWTERLQLMNNPRQPWDPRDRSDVGFSVPGSSSLQ